MICTFIKFWLMLGVIAFIIACIYIVLFERDRERYRLGWFTVFEMLLLLITNTIGGLISLYYVLDYIRQYGITNKDKE